MTYTTQQKQHILELKKELARRKSQRYIETLFPDEGLYRRGLYLPHVKFFAAGAEFRQRSFMGGNRSGKTITGCFEATCHLTGVYPHWWKGKRFEKPGKWWAAGDTGQTVRDVLQETFLGPPEAMGTGMIPGDLIEGQPKRKAGTIPDAIESVVVKHISGGFSKLVFKSYDQKRKAFQGTKLQGILMDEEPPLPVYSECLMRTMKTAETDIAGLILLTFTPLLGLSEVVEQFMPDGMIPEEPAGGKFIVSATWDEAPHLSKEEKDELYAEIPPYQRNARTKGIPQLGAGAVYPIDEEEITFDERTCENTTCEHYKSDGYVVTLGKNCEKCPHIKRFELPPYWPRAYALDVGWNCTAVMWMAYDKANDTIYIYKTYRQGEQQPHTHVAAIKAMGEWVPGLFDAGAQGRNMKDGTKLVDEYTNLGLHLYRTDDAVEAGITKVWLRMTTGRFKVFKSCWDFFREFRMYQRDEEGKIKNKSKFHLMDDARYLVLSGIDIAQEMSYEEAYSGESFIGQGHIANKRMGY